MEERIRKEKRDGDCVTQVDLAKLTAKRDVFGTTSANCRKIRIVRRIAR